MNIIYHHRTRGEDAQGIHVRALCDAFGRAGNEVCMVAPFARGEASKRDSGPSNVEPSLSGRALPRVVYEAIALAYNFFGLGLILLRGIQRRPAFIYERYSLFCVCGLIAARILRVPFVLEINAPLSEETRREDGLVFERLARASEDWLCKNAHRTYTVSAAMKQIFVARGIPEGRIAILPNGVDSSFNPGVSGKSWRKKLGLEDRLVIGFVGWVRPWHGVDRLVSAIGKLQAGNPGISLLIAGDGPALPALRSQVERMEMQARVCFTGPVDRQAVPEIVAAMDIAVQPEVTPYASPMKLFEYMATGRAIVAPDRSNIGEIISHEQNGLLFSAGSADALAEALQRMIKDADLRQRLGKNAARTVTERGYTWDAIAERVIGDVNRVRNGG